MADATRAALREESRARVVADESGLRAAFVADGAAMLRYARRALRERDRADDVVQETFARAWRSRARFDPALGSLRGWLFAIERRVIIDLSRRDAVTTSLNGEFDELVGDDGYDLDRAMRGWLVESALARLSPEHRTVIAELYFNGRSGRDVAQLLAVPEGTVRSRAYYALRTLRVALEEAGWNE